MLSNDFVGLKWLQDLCKKVFAKAKTDNYFERNIACTRTSNATVITAATHTLSTWSSLSNDDAWAKGTFTIIAPATGWYWLYAAGITTSGETRAMYIAKNGVTSRNAEYGGGRDFSTNPIWVQKGTTIGYGGRMITTLTLKYTVAYDA